MRNPIIIFVAASLYTLLLLVVGVSVGYFFGAREEQLAKRRQQLKQIKLKIRNRGQESGTVTPRKLTKAEADAQERQPFTDRFEELVGPNPPETIGFLDEQ